MSNDGMYLVDRTENKREMTARGFGGGGFSADDAEKADRMETWGTTYTPDDAPDFVELRLIKDGVCFKTRRVDGY